MIVFEYSTKLYVHYSLVSTNIALIIKIKSLVFYDYILSSIDYFYIHFNDFINVDKYSAVLKESEV